ncbi:hypothetical protein CKA32_003200 [Geitlerinema sp. FC II]|nr:hypothetical protein CKA32_003200 [Geitlerinema sp. FC II]
MKNEAQSDLGCFLLRSNQPTFSLGLTPEQIAEVLDLSLDDVR